MSCLRLEKSKGIDIKRFVTCRQRLSSIDMTVIFLSINGDRRQYHCIRASFEVVSVYRSLVYSCQVDCQTLNLENWNNGCSVDNNFFELCVENDQGELLRRTAIKSRLTGNLEAIRLVYTGSAVKGRIRRPQNGNLTL